MGRKAIRKAKMKTKTIKPKLETTKDEFLKGRCKTVSKRINYGEIDLVCDNPIIYNASRSDPYTIVGLAGNCFYEKATYQYGDSDKYINVDELEKKGYKGHKKEKVDTDTKKETQAKTPPTPTSDKEEIKTGIKVVLDNREGLEFQAKRAGESARNIINQSEIDFTINAPEYVDNDMRISCGCVFDDKSIIESELNNYMPLVNAITRTGFNIDIQSIAPIPISWIQRFVEVDNRTKKGERKKEIMTENEYRSKLSRISKSDRDKFTIIKQNNGATKILGCVIDNDTDFKNIPRSVFIDDMLQPNQFLYEKKDGKGNTRIIDKDGKPVNILNLAKEKIYCEISEMVPSNRAYLKDGKEIPKGTMMPFKDVVKTEALRGYEIDFNKGGYYDPEHVNNDEFKRIGQQCFVNINLGPKKQTVKKVADVTVKVTNPAKMVKQEETMKQEKNLEEGFLEFDFGLEKKDTGKKPKKEPKKEGVALAKEKLYQSEVRAIKKKEIEEEKLKKKKPEKEKPDTTSVKK